MRHNNRFRWQGSGIKSKEVQNTRHDVCGVHGEKNERGSSKKQNRTKIQRGAPMHSTKHCTIQIGNTMGKKSVHN